MKNPTKSASKAKKVPSLTKRRKTSPKNLKLKKTASYSTNSLAAKVYLQNGRVVIPNFKDYKDQKDPKESKSRKNSNR